MKKAIYPGSFDPITNGHMDILERVAVIFDEVIIAIMVHRHKKPLFTIEERVEMIKTVTQHLPNVTVESSELLLADYCAKKGNPVVVRGLRAVSDFEHEFQMALINRKMNPEMDTMFLTASESNQYLSSSVIKEISMFGGSIHEFLPGAIHKEVEKRLHEIYLEVTNNGSSR